MIIHRDCCSATCLRNRSVEALVTAALVQAIREAQEPRTLQELEEKKGLESLKDQLVSCTAICLHESDMDELPEELNGPDVEFFLLNSKHDLRERDNLRIPNSFFLKECKSSRY